MDLNIDEVSDFSLKVVNDLMAKVRAKYPTISPANDDYIGDMVYLCLKRHIIDILEDQE